MNVFVNVSWRRTASLGKINDARSYSSNVSRLKILFFGTDNFSLPSLKVIHRNWKQGRTVGGLEVVTSFKAAKNPVKQFSVMEGIPVSDWQTYRPNENFDLGVVVSFGHLIQEEIINSFNRGMLNVHASLLPQLRGAAPIVHAIANGNRQTGISIMRIEPKRFDIGAILLQSTVDIPRDMLMPQLHDDLAQLGADCLMKCIENLDFYNGQAVQQDGLKATYAPKIDRNFAEIRWNHHTALQIYDLYRSLYSLAPLKTWFCGEAIKLFEITYSHDQRNAEKRIDKVPGCIEYSRQTKKLLVWCCDGFCIEVLQLSVGGKKMLTAQDFHNGFLSKVAYSRRVFG
ncbi:methionyl-tRNA formyltransferase, mitochondrial-like [Anopheles albimanus]|uniref:Methionyl-tRNA formyltransferase, mitochondrial n=1 Tax=Anopheles albimanus TaxID=7167 RepID=A0A182FJ71_ANOAL|nr:methionyl-tRNA formyltransferase, mitochondrial-like [Anopheles albimanus]